MKYTRADDEIFETSEPSATNARTLTFTTAPDALWMAAKTGVHSGGKGGGSYSFSYPAYLTVEIDGVDYGQVKNGELLNVSGSAIKITPNVNDIVWFEVIGVNK